jgi:hypothetical protein
VTASPGGSTKAACKDEKDVAIGVPDETSATLRVTCR